MRTIIAGSRGVTDPEVVFEAVRQSGIKPSVVISGGARGVDRLGEIWAETYRLPFERYPAQWKLDGKSAGYKRNEIMAYVADALIAVWDGKSRGTKHMIDTAQRIGLQTYVYKVDL